MSETSPPPVEGLEGLLVLHRLEEVMELQQSIGRVGGPDCEPLPLDVTLLTVVDAACLEQAQQVYCTAFAPGRV